MKISWVVTNCSTVAEANHLGTQLLQQRLIACYDIVLRSKSVYFWPPKSGRIERAKGAQLILVTLPKYAARITAAVQQMHSDKVPMIGSLSINVTPSYGRWVKGEVKA